MSTHGGAAVPSPANSLGDSFAERRASEFGLERALIATDLDAALEETRPGAVFDCTVPEAHVGVTRTALRHGWQVLPPAAFRYATRGINLFAASLIWGLAAAVLIYGSMGLAVFAMLSLTPGSSDGNGTRALPYIVFPLMLGITTAFGLIIIALYVFIPPLILYTDRTGLGGAFNIAGFVHAIRTSPSESVAAAAMALVSYFISGLGSYLCYVGILFTVPYSLAILAGVLRWYEVNAKPGALP